MARVRHDRRGVRRAVGALLIGAFVAAGPSVAGGQETPAPSPVTTTKTVLLASGVDGVGLSSATDDLDGSPLEVRVVEPTFPAVYGTVEGAKLITDRWSSDGKQGRSWATDLGAKVVNKPVAPVVGEQYFDYGPGWYSKRTYRATVEIPAGAEVGVGLMDLMADNNVAVSVVNSAGRTVVAPATCVGYDACDSEAGRDNYRKARTVSIDPSVFRSGTNTFEFAVEDWGTVVGLMFKVGLTMRVDGVSVPPACAGTAPGISCSLTAAVLSNLPAGTARYCYASSDGVARTFRVPTADGQTLVYTLSSGTWVDAPIPAGDVVFYPVEDAPVRFAAITDPALSRCPGAVPAPTA